MNLVGQNGAPVPKVAMELEVNIAMAIRTTSGQYPQVVLGLEGSANHEAAGITADGLTGPLLCTC